MPATSLTGAEQQLSSVVVALGVHGPLGAAVARARQAAAAFGARVELLADGRLVAVLSGRGSAHDQARQAARCALAIRDVLEDALLALVTGPTTPGVTGIAGDVIERAMPLLHALPSSTSRRARPIAIDEATQGLLDAQFDVSVGDGPILLRRERPNAQVEGARTLLGRPAPFVGREREMGALEGIVRECIDERVAHAVLVTGPSGVGKTRLRHELLRRLRERGEAVEVWIARGNPLSAGSALEMIAQLVRAAAGVAEGETLAARQAKLGARISRHVPIEASVRATDFLGELTGIRFPEARNPELQAARRNPRLMGDQMRRAWYELLSAECDAHPVVIVLEDLHWGDLSTVSYLDGALRNLRDRPLVVLALAQPDVHRVFPQIWVGHPMTELRLGELSRKASEKLVREVVGPNVDDATVARVVDHAAGNAFYLEELIRFVAEGRHELPATVVAMAQARIAALEPDARRMLRAASIFGATFWQSGVAALVGASEGNVAAQLDELSRRELVAPREGGRYAEEYVFRHGIVREAAYGLLTDDDRVLGHQLAGDWLERQGDTDGMAIAEHFERGAMPARATVWYERAAIQALEGNDFDAVTTMVTKGIASGAEGEQKGRLHVLEAQAHRWRGRFLEAEAALRPAIKLLPRGSDVWCEAAGASLSIGVHLGRAEALEHLVADLTDDTAVRTATAARVGACTRALVPLLFEGHAAMGSRLLTYVEKAGGQSTDPGVAARVHQARATRALWSDDPCLYLTESELAARSFDRVSDLRNTCKQRGHVGFAQAMLGAYGPAETTLRGVLGSAERMGLPTLVVGTRATLGVILAYRGSLHEARAVEERALEEAEAAGQELETLGAKVYLAEIMALGANLEAAERVVQQALTVTRGRFRQLRAYALSTYASVLLAGKRHTEALEAAREGRALLEGHVARSEAEGRIHVAYALALRGVGDEEGSLEAILAAREYVQIRAARVTDDELRRSFLESVSANAMTLALAEEWSMSRVSRASQVS